MNIALARRDYRLEVSKPLRRGAPSMRAMRTAHRKAYRKMVLAEDALSLIEPAPKALVTIHVTNALGQTMAIRCSTHTAIGDTCEEYIEASRKRGKWGNYHNPRRGRLDAHGVFHDLEAACCPGPDAGAIVFSPTPATRPPFDDASLAEYRARIDFYHGQLDDRCRAADERNDESGWTKAQALHFAASQDEGALWKALLKRAVTGSRQDVKEVCAHQRAIFNAEFYRVLQAPDGSTKRTVRTVECEHLERAQDIVRELGKPKERKSK